MKKAQNLLRHETAIIHPDAQLADNVEVGPYTIIEKDVEIGRGTKIGPHVQICRWTVIGEDCQIFFGCSIGNSPKDTKHKNERSCVKIGDRNIFREYVSISRATGKDDATIIGNDNILMNYVNIAHDCIVGNGVIMANLATVGGHVVFEDQCRVGGKTTFHQFVRVGKFAMAGAASKFVQDVPPFTVSDGHPARVRGLNIIGIRTSSINPMSSLSQETLKMLKKAYRILFRSNLNMSQAIKQVREGIEPNEEVEYLLNFIENSQRGIGV